MTASCRLQAERRGRRGQRPPGSGTFSIRKNDAGDAGGALAASTREQGCSRSQLVVFPSRLVAGYLLDLTNPAVCWCPQNCAVLGRVRVKHLRSSSHLLWGPGGDTGNG